MSRESAATDAPGAIRIPRAADITAKFRAGLRWARAEKAGCAGDLSRKAKIAQLSRSVAAAHNRPLLAQVSAAHSRILRHAGTQFSALNT
jgi:hypothetical protein